MTAPLLVYSAALRRAAGGHPARLDILRPGGQLVESLDTAEWSGGLRPGDAELLGRCALTTLDVGCGPGRLAAGLHAAGHSVLGVDVVPEAIRQTRSRGAPAVIGDIFNDVPLAGLWRTVLLADGNIGIGGAPVPLLRRCAQVTAGTGVILVEVRAPGQASWSAQVVLRHGDRRSTPFPWACVSVDRIAEVADAACLRVLRVWTVAGRWFAECAGSA